MAKGDGVDEVLFEVFVAVSHTSSVALGETVGLVDLLAAVVDKSIQHGAVCSPSLEAAEFIGELRLEDGALDIEVAVGVVVDMKRR